MHRPQLTKHSKQFKQLKQLKQLPNTKNTRERQLHARARHVLYAAVYAWRSMLLTVVIAFNHTDHASSSTPVW